MDSILELFKSMLSTVNTYLYSYVLIAMLVLTGLYFTVRTGFMQFRMLPESIRVLTEKKKDGTGVSSFQALMISTASRVGTGNIAGVATALAAGGPGAIFWMWLLALIGGASAFIESTLAQIYKIKNGDEYLGGPAYYIQIALGQRWLGIIFAILLIACFAVGFNALQSFNIASAFSYYKSAAISAETISLICGIVLAAATAFVIFGGVNRIGFISSVIVPIMAVLYILLGLYITITNITAVPAILADVFSAAFDVKAIAGGFAGSCVMLGIKRGLFSNEAGMGSAPNAAAAASVSHPVKQGLVQMLSVFLDTLVICTTTGMMLLIYGVDSSLTGMPYVQQAVASQIGEVGIHFVTIAILLFAFSSVIGNYCYAESNIRFIKDNKIVLTVFRIACVIVVLVGAMGEFSVVWDLADVLMGFMAIVNIIAILLLGNKALLALKDYNSQKQDGKDPHFHPKELGIEKTECWDE